MSKRTRVLGKSAKSLTIPKLTQTFAVGARVIVAPQVKYKGMPHARYRGRHGQVKKKQGNAYVVEIKDGGKMKELIIPAVHLESVAIAAKNEKE